MTVRMAPALAMACLAGALGCSDTKHDDAVGIGLLLSYSGSLSANSINSERAILMAIERANAAGGLSGRPIAIFAADTSSEPRRTTASAQKLLDAGVAVFIGPDTVELAVHLKALLTDRTVILPSFTTSDSTIYKPQSWFVMGAPAARVACELFAQLRADGRPRPLIIADPSGYNALLSFELERRYLLPRVTLPTDEASNDVTVGAITASSADAYVLAALPAGAASLLYTMAAVGALSDPSRWYLSPTLHTPALLEVIPSGLMVGAHGVAAGTGTGGADFRAAFAARWRDAPLDDAYAFYDAGAVAMLALQRALVRTGTIPTGTGLSPDIIAVTRPNGEYVRWDQIGRGLAILQSGQEITYEGLSRPLEFDLTGQTQVANTSWWTIGNDGFADVASHSDCR